MYSFNELTKRERYYLNRKKRLDEKFVWTQEKIQNLREVNDSLSLMQERIIEGVKKVSTVFSRLEAGGMDFLHGFKVVGRFDFGRRPGVGWILLHGLGLRAEVLILGSTLTSHS